MSHEGHGTCTVIIVHACTIILVRACAMIMVHACTMIIIHVSCPTGLCSEKFGTGEQGR